MFIYIHPEDLYLYLQGEKINMKNNKKGFTLMEMLIVVAIIAVLVAIAIPVLNGTLEKSREATDAANLRAAYAECAIAVLDGSQGNGVTVEDGTASKTVYATQTQADWQNTSIENIAGYALVKDADTTTTNGIKAVTKGGYWTVAVKADGSVTFVGTAKE